VSRSLASGIFLWVRRIGFPVFTCFFLFFGIDLLISAYRLNDPFLFVMTFFAASLIILISATLLLGFIIRVFSSSESSKDGGTQ